MWAVNIGMGRESKGRGGGVIRGGGGVNRLNSNFSERLDLFRGGKKEKETCLFFQECARNANPGRAASCAEGMWRAVDLFLFFFLPRASLTPKVETSGTRP